ncbi:MAG: hypothetical protein ACREYC_12235, partial [Gammaproteobacteria bacterium]
TVHRALWRGRGVHAAAGSLRSMLPGHGRLGIDCQTRHRAPTCLAQMPGLLGAQEHEELLRPRPRGRPKKPESAD